MPFFQYIPLIMLLMLMPHKTDMSTTPFIHPTLFRKISQRINSTCDNMCRTSNAKLMSDSLGPVDMSTVAKVEVKITDADKARLERMEARPSLSEILNLHDFEVRPSCTPTPFLSLNHCTVHQAIAKLVMPEKGWAYYSSASDDEITTRENHAAYHRHVPHEPHPRSALTQFQQDMVPSTDTA